MHCLGGDGGWCVHLVHDYIPIPSLSLRDTDTQHTLHFLIPHPSLSLRDTDTQHTFHSLPHPPFPLPSKRSASASDRSLPYSFAGPRCARATPPLLSASQVGSDPGDPRHPPVTCTAPGRVRSRRPHCERGAGSKKKEATRGGHTARLRVVERRGARRQDALPEHCFVVMVVGLSARTYFFLRLWVLWWTVAHGRREG